MPLFSIIAAKSAPTVISKLATWGYKKLTAQQATAYEVELQRVILSAVAAYEHEFPIPDTDRIPFYHSQAFFDLLLEFRFTKQMAQSGIEALLRANPLIIPPSAEQLAAFFEIFDAEIKTSKKLARLNLDDNFKEEIFSISQLLRSLQADVTNSILALKQDILLANRGVILIEEWNKQVDEIYQHVNAFKPVTALGRLAALKQRIEAAGIVSDPLFARISSIQAFCLIQCEEPQKRPEIAECLIRAYKLQPAHPDYKANAGLSYATLGDTEKAGQIADSILRIDEFDSSGWLIKVLSAKEDFAAVLATTPAIVKTKLHFQLRLYHWLNSRHHVEKTSALTSFGIHIQLNPAEPLVVTANNLQIWLIKALYLLNTYYEKKTHISTQLADARAKDDINFQRGINILEAVHTALQGTEMEPCLANYWFELFTGSFILTEDPKHLAAMEKWFPQVAPRQPITVIRMYQGLNALRTNEGIGKACRVLENNFTDDEPELYYLAAVSYDFLRDAANSEKNFLHYVHAKQPVPRQSMVNILLFLRRATITFGESGIRALQALATEGNFESPVYSDLLAIACYFRFQTGLAPDELLTRLERAAATLNTEDVELYLTVVYAWCTLELFQPAKAYLEANINLSEESEGLKLYCKVLYSVEGSKARLLELLGYWRSHFSPDPELADIELHLYSLARNWAELAVVARWAIQQWPFSEKCIYLLFKALLNLLDLEGIVASAPLVENRVFKFTDSVPLIYAALLKASLFQQALDLLYQHARVKENIACRQAYLTSTIQFPGGYFVDYPDVTVGRYIVYQIRGQNTILEVTEANQHSIPAKYFLGKKTGETLSIPAPVTGALEPVTISRVCNSYLALFQEILFDTENPLSGLDVQMFKIDDDKPENLFSKLIATFGATGTVESDRVQIELEKYYNGQLSFSEITNSVFRRHPVDAYFVLTAKNGKLYKAISPAISKSVLLTREDQFLLDFTSICLFYECSEQLSISFPRKFLVSGYTRELLFRLLQETTDSPPSDYSISITQEKVTPHFYGPHHQENRIRQLQSIIDWVDTHCSVERAEEILDFIVASTNHGGMDPYLLSLLDNRLLINRPNCYLLSNDTMYYRYLSTGPDKCISPVCYLAAEHQEASDRALDLMLERNYIGIPISAAALTRELFKLLSDQPNKFSICLENLRANWNPDPQNSIEAVRFIKNLYSSTVLVPAVRQQIVSLVFSNVVVGLSPQRIQLLRLLLTSEFKLMGLYLDEVLQLYQFDQGS